MSAIYTCDNCGKTAKSSFELIQKSPRGPLTGWWGTPGGYDACCGDCYDVLLAKIAADETCSQALRNEAAGILESH